MNGNIYLEGEGDGVCKVLGRGSLSAGGAKHRRFPLDLEVLQLIGQG